MKKFILALSLGASLCLTACPGKVDPGQNAHTGIKKISRIWGVPEVHAITAGFNGMPSEPNFTGPANTANTTNPSK